LVGYLIQQGLQSMNTRLKELRNFYPDAKAEDWKLIDAGIRVQAIKKEDGDAGIVHFGTEVVTSEDRSISALLGASPGASVCVNIVLEVARKCFGELFAREEVQKKLSEMIPTYRNKEKKDKIDYSEFKNWVNLQKKPSGCEVEICYKNLLSEHSIFDGRILLSKVRFNPYGRKCIFSRIHNQYLAIY
jgi:hypothetical protein